MEVSQGEELKVNAGGRTKRASSVREIKVIKKYDPFQEPADLEMASEHGKAKRVYRNRKEDKQKTENNKVCPCCGLVIGGDNIPLTADLEEIYFLGCGFPSYFIFIKYSIMLLVSVFLISGMFNLVTNYFHSECSTHNSKSVCGQGFILSFALSNKRNNPKLLTIFLILNLTSVCFVTLFFHFIRYKLRKTEKIVDNATVTPSDYTLELRGVEPSMSNEDVINWLKSFQTVSKANGVVKINRTYNIKEYIQFTKQKVDLIKEKTKYENNISKLEELDNKITEIESKLENFKKKDLEPTTVLFAVFDSASEADSVRLRFQKGFLRKRFERLLSRFISTFDRLAGKRVVVQRAPEPTEILWENLGYTPYEQFKKKIIVNLATYVLVFTEFLLVVLISWAQDRVKYEVGEGYYVRFLSLVCSVLTFLWDLLSAHIIKKLASREKNPTLTAYYTEVAGKLSIVQLINTGLTPLLAKLVIAGNFSSNYTFKDRFKLVNIYDKGGLIENMYFIFIVHAFFPPLLTIFDPEYIYQYFQKKRLLKGQRVKLTQSQAHDFFEGPDLDIADKYATLIRAILLASFYAPAMPFALIYSISGLILSYWADKYILLRRIALPKVLNNGLTNSMVEYLEWMALTFAVVKAGNLIFLYILDDPNDKTVFNSNIPIFLLWITLGVSLFHIYFPMEWLNRKMFRIMKERTETETYGEARFDFTTDYDIENPITRKRALQEFLFQVRGLIEMGSSAHRFDATKEGAFAKLTHLDLLELMNSPNKEEGQDFQFLDHYAKEIQVSSLLTRKKSTFKLSIDMIQILSKFNNFRLKHNKTTYVNQFVLNAKTLIGICDDMKRHDKNSYLMNDIEDEPTVGSPYTQVPKFIFSKDLETGLKVKERSSICQSINEASKATADEVGLLLEDKRRMDLSSSQIQIKSDGNNNDEEYNDDEKINIGLREEFAQRKLVVEHKVRFSSKKTKSIHR